MQSAQTIDDTPRSVPNLPEERAHWRFGRMAGRSPAMQRLFSQMRYTVRHMRVAVIEGEPGTGKMLAARTLHESGPGSNSPFVSFHAAQLFESTPGLPEAYEAARPEFSAVAALKRSCGGTLALTHVDVLSAAHQVRLLGLLQWLDHQHVLRAADSVPRRVLCVSGRPLRKLVSTGALRSDLASRMASIRFTLPPLRERREDISLLAGIFVERFSATHNKPIRGLGPQTLPRLVQHNWPGNVRELESVIDSACLSCQGQWIRPIDLPALTAAPTLSVVAPGLMPDDDPNLDRAILRHIQTVLARAEGNKLRAAKMLGISRSTLYRMLDSTSISKVS